MNEQQGSQKLGHKRPIGCSSAIATSNLDGCGFPGEGVVYKREGSHRCIWQQTFGHSLAEARSYLDESRSNEEVAVIEHHLSC